MVDLPMDLVYHRTMASIDYVKNVFVSVDRELWKAAKVLAVKQDRPVRLVVADGLRLMLKEAEQAGGST